jgi:hypothetical protein
MVLDYDRCLTLGGSFLYHIDEAPILKSGPFEFAFGWNGRRISNMATHGDEKL